METDLNKWNQWPHSVLLIQIFVLENQSFTSVRNFSFLNGGIKNTAIKSGFAAAVQKSTRNKQHSLSRVISFRIELHLIDAGLIS